LPEKPQFRRELRNSVEVGNEEEEEEEDVKVRKERS